MKKLENFLNTRIDLLKKYRLTESLLLLLLLTPLLSYITFGIYYKENAIYYFQIFFVFYGIFLLFFNRFLDIRIPKYLYLLIFYIIYILFWSFSNGTFEKKGIFFSEFREQLAIFFILLIIYNINFSDIFIKYSLKIIKLTIIIAFLASLYQFFDPSFLDASPLYKFRYFEKPTIDLSSPYEFRRLSIFGYTDLNDLGLSFLPLLAIYLGYFAQKKKNNYIIYAMGLVTAALSNTRYIIVGAFLLIIIFWISNRLSLSGYIKNIFIFLLLLIFTGVILKFIGYDLIDWFSVRLFAEKSIQSTTRFGALENFIRFFPKTPIFGTGVHLTAEIALASAAVGSSQIHVGYLSHLVSYGIIGSFFLFGFWFFILKDLYRTAKLTNYWGSFFAFLVFIWANFTLVMYSIYFYGLIFALIFNKYMQDKYLILYGFNNN
ncbi:MAG: hypothetical protein NUV92_05525 [Ignavibacteria bacterium]|jgi:hypothetical protein|nr:hypothetical protein [Ignavibacteria bacterium]MDH7527484.1 hypothetical protein [Ignavibacteria bacterium]